MGFEAAPLPFLYWVAIVGGLLLVLALTSAYVRRLPVSTSTIYLILGVGASPVGLGWLRIDVGAAARWFERVTEVGVLLALFVGGLKLRLPPSDRRWVPAYLLAGPVMVVSIGAVAWLAHALLHLDVATSLLLGSVLAPTDPVLASAVSLNDSRDRDRMRYGLSGEAGLNDGMAFPFVVLALGLYEHGGAGAWLGEWAAQRLLWAVPAALIVGYLFGNRVGRLAMALRHRTRDNGSPTDFLALAIIALSYVLAEVIGAWGFLAVFAAGVGLRSAETAVIAERPHPRVHGEHPPAEHLVPAIVDPKALEEPAVAAGAVVSETTTFGDTAERMVEMTLVLVVGVALADHFDWRGVPIALVLFFVIRPLATWLVLKRTRTRPLQRALLGWFGIRGIGSLYYLSYALRHGVTGTAARDVVDIALTVIAMSIVVHGISATPVLAFYERAEKRRRARRDREPRSTPLTV